MIKFEFDDCLTKEMIPGYVWDEIERYIYEKNNNISEANYTFRNAYALVGLARSNNRINDRIANEIKARLIKIYR